jgi:hypothetical protein
LGSRLTSSLSGFTLRCPVAVYHLPLRSAVSGPAAHKSQQRLTGQQVGLETVKAAKDQAQPAAIPLPFHEPK